MNELVIITRPKSGAAFGDDAATFEAELQAAGFKTFSEPMLEIKVVDFEIPALAGYEALLFTSARAVRVFADRAKGAGRNIPVFAVGTQTAQVAYDCGFHDVRNAGGDARALAGLVAAVLSGETARPLLHIRGQHTAQKLDELLEPEGFSVDTLVVYEAQAVKGFSKDFLEIWQSGQPLSLTFFSARTAENFMRLAGAAKTGKQSQSKAQGIKALCISDGVLKCVQHEPETIVWSGVYVSKTPDRAAMVQLVKTVAQAPVMQEHKAEHKKEDKNMSNKAKQKIENAEEIIERFGGIRPMAKKMDVAVTTVQGWKKRNVIPGARTEQVMKAAGTHNIDLSDIIDGAPKAPASSEASVHANENTAKEEPKAETKPEAPAVPKQPEEAQEEAQKAAPPPITASGSVPRSTKKPESFERKPEKRDPEAPHSESHTHLMAQLQESEQKAVSKSIWITVFLILVTVAAVLVLLWPDSKSNTERLAELEEQQSFLTTLIPEDLDARIAALQDKAQDAKVQAEVAVEKAREVSRDVLAEDAGTLEQRVVKLQAHAGDVLADPRFDGLKTRFEEMSNSLLGQQKMEQSMAELSAVLAGLGGTGERAQVNEALDSARQQSASLDETLQGVPKEDLQAAALLLTMTQFRSSLNRDNQPFGDDLALLMNLVGEDNTALRAALERLAPRAQEGVLTPTGLSDEFKTIAGDVVVASLKGEDVSIQEKTTAKLNELFQVEKDGELLTGTPTQAIVAKANTKLEQGDIAGAIAEMQTLDGAEAEAAQPWIDEAQATLLAQELKKFLSGAANGLDAMHRSGTLIQDEEAGINILVPAEPLKMPGQSR